MDKQREIDQKRMELKPDLEKAGEAIEKTISEKAFRRDKQREEDLKRMEIKPDIKGISEKIEEEIKKIEEKKKEE